MQKSISCINYKDPTTAPHNTLDKAFEAARESLEDKEQTPKKQWISDHTLSLVIEKHRMEETNDPEVTNKIKEVNKSRRADWKNFAHNLVTNEMDNRDQWLGIKLFKKKRFCLFRYLFENLKFSNIFR